MKLFVKEQIAKIIELIEKFRNTLKKTAEINPYIMPGYTHLQLAQVVTFKYHLMAYYHMMGRDKQRSEDLLKFMKELPLGCGALTDLC